MGVADQAPPWQAVVWGCLWVTAGSPAAQAALLQAQSTATRCREVLLGTRAQECLWLVDVSLPKQGTHSLIASGH